MRSWKTGLSLLILFISVYSFNHPEIKWKTVGTEHFIINYYDKTEPAVYATWKIAEETYTALAPLYDYKYRKKIEISLADYDDYSNGWADFTTSSVMIWISDSRFDLRGNSIWLRNVLTHEIAHIISLENRKRLQMIDITANFQYGSPNEQLLVKEPFAKLTFYPNWFSEGLAQLESERMGHDFWDSRREMLLRTAVVNNTALSLDEMNYFNHDSRGNEMVYNQGYSLITYIEKKFGHAAIASICTAGAQSKIDFASYFAEHTGTTLHSCYMEWRDSLKQYYSAKFPPIIDNAAIYKKGTFNKVPHVSSDGKLWGWLSSGRDDADRTDLLICNMGETDVKFRIPYAKESWCFSSDSKKAFFIKSKDPDENGSYLNDVFVFDIEKKNIQKLTNNSRVYNITTSPISGALAVVSYADGAFSLCKLDENTGKTSELVKGIMGEPIIGSSWSSLDSTLIAFEKVVSGRSTLFIYSTKDKTARQVSSGKASEESPYWATDGRIYYSADYNGVFEIYSIKDDGSDLKKHGSSMGGSFSPCLSKDNKIIVSEYGKNGFAIAQVGGEGKPFEISSNEYCMFKPLPVPKGKVTIKSNPYKPHLGRAVWELQFIGSVLRNKNLLIENEDSDQSDSSILQLGVAIANFRSDPLQKKTSSIGAAIGIINMNGENDSVANGNKSLFNDDYIKKNGYVLSNKISNKFDLKSKYIRKNEYSETFRKNLMMMEKESYDSESSDSEENEHLIMPFMQPFYSMTNSNNTPTYGLDISAAMLMMIIPAEVNVNAFIERQLSDKLYLSCALNTFVYPFAGQIYGTIPISLSWSNIGYFNKDINYNYNDYSQIVFNCGPQFLPQSKVYFNEDEYSVDTMTFTPSGVFADAALFHGFPLGKYTSLQLFTYDKVEYYNRQILDPYIDGSSRTYFESQTGINCAFPLLRNINSGVFNYHDALYANIGYTLFGRVNGEFFSSDNYKKDLLLDEDFSENALVGHMVNLSLVLGSYKSYQFFRKISVDVNYEVLRKQLFLSVTSGF